MRERHPGDEVEGGDDLAGAGTRNHKMMKRVEKFLLSIARVELAGLRSRIARCGKLFSIAQRHFFAVLSEMEPEHGDQIPFLRTSHCAREDVEGFGFSADRN